MDRRTLLIAAAAVPLGARASGDAPVAALLKAGGCVIAFRHALAPGTFDPPEFRIGDCRTQRNLNDEGRAQARRVGAWMRQHSLVPAAVKSSPWCRCVDTAELAFGRVEPWALLGSPRGSTDAVNARRVPELIAAVAAVPTGRFEAWVTHNFVLSDLAGSSAGQGEGLLLRPGADGRIAVIGRLAVA